MVAPRAKWKRYVTLAGYTSERKFLLDCGTYENIMTRIRSGKVDPRNMRDDTFEKIALKATGSKDSASEVKNIFLALYRTNLT